MAESSISTSSRDKLIVVGDSIERTVRYTREDIEAFARLSFDENPLHSNDVVAQRARFGEVIASGQQTAAILMGMLATHFSRRDDGVLRQVLCLNMNFAYKVPVFAEQDVKLSWQVSTAEWHGRLNGMLAHLDGRAFVVAGRPAVIARGTLLVSEEQQP